LGAFVQKRILDEIKGKMTRSSAIWANDVEANDLGDDKPTSLRANTSLPFDDTREDDDDKEEDDFFDVETGWYVQVSIFLLPIGLIYWRNLKKGSWIW
jgi:hypothetical protein